MSQKYRLGRAELKPIDQVQREGLFEGVSPRQIYPWATEPFREGWSSSYYHGNFGWLLGEIGSGKSHFIRNFGKDVPIRHYEINKETMKYEAKINSDKPGAIFVDDLHILLLTMAASRSAGNEVLTEENVIKILQGFSKEANDARAKLIFASNETPQSMRTLFLSWEYRNMFDDITVSILEPNEKSSWRPWPNFLDYNDRLGNETAAKVRERNKMHNFPVRMVENPWSFAVEMENEWRVKNELMRKGASKLRINRNDYKLGYFVNQDYEFIAFHADSIWQTRPFEEHARRFIRPLRELEVVADHIGGINIGTLEVDFSQSAIIDTEYVKRIPGHVYSQRDMEHIVIPGLMEIYEDITAGEVLPLYKKVLDVSSDEEAKSILAQIQLARA